jgi:hypothetical protein
VPHAATRIVHVAEPTGDYVQVKVLDGLACGKTVIEAHVVAIGSETAVQEYLGFIDRSQQRFAFRRVKVTPGWHMAMRYDQQVPFGHGKGVPDALHQRADEGDPISTREAKRARRGFQGGFRVVQRPDA